MSSIAENKAVVAELDAIGNGSADLNARLIGPAARSAGSTWPPGLTRDVAFAYRLRDAHIAERWAIRDDLAMLQQLGTTT